MSKIAKKDDFMNSYLNPIISRNFLKKIQDNDLAFSKEPVLPEFVIKSKISLKNIKIAERKNNYSTKKETNSDDDSFDKNWVLAYNGNIKENLTKNELKENIIQNKKKKIEAMVIKNIKKSQIYSLDFFLKKFPIPEIDKIKDNHDNSGFLTPRSSNSVLESMNFDIELIKVEEEEIYRESFYNLYDLKRYFIYLSITIPQQSDNVKHQNDRVIKKKFGKLYSQVYLRKKAENEKYSSYDFTLADFDKPLNID